jgi:hypothetical protein
MCEASNSKTGDLRGMSDRTNENEKCNQVSPPETEERLPPLFLPDFLYAVDEASIPLLAESKDVR